MSILTILGHVEVAICVAALCFIVFKRQWSDYWALGSFLAVRVVSSIFLDLLMHSVHRLNPHTAYHIYFYVYWAAFATESILALFIVYGIFRGTLAPLKGLQRLGMPIFTVVGAISVAVALASAFAPHTSGTKFVVAGLSQLQRTQSVLTLGLLVFVGFAIRPMGLSFRSKIFGVSLGLGLMATNDMVASVWLASNPYMARAYSLINGVVICTILVIWTAYFALPEPRRREISLPATSPFLRWNKMCLAWTEVI